ncbi:microsomal signal peptidase 12 kDa subunit-domain-containing protein [Morchella snyderi]|nr:microsomal signal peptidase 12 kDa subunit-domain-containing protein [Morchella snyderi]
MNQIQTIVDGFIDFEGQNLADSLTTTIIAFTGILAFIVGWVLSDLKYTVYIGLSGATLAFLAVVPPWPMYNKNPLVWPSVTEGKVEIKKER